MAPGFETTSPTFLFSNTGVNCASRVGRLDGGIVAPQFFRAPARARDQLRMDGAPALRRREVEGDVGEPFGWLGLARRGGFAGDVELGLEVDRAAEGRCGRDRLSLPRRGESRDSDRW